MKTTRVLSIIVAAMFLSCTTSVFAAGHHGKSHKTAHHAHKTAHHSHKAAK